MRTLRKGKSGWGTYSLQNVFRKKRQEHKAEYEFLKRIGVCTGCRKKSALPGKTLCPICSKKSSEKLSTFEPPPKQTGTPRHPIEYYGLTDDRVAELVKLIQSGRYATLALQAAHRADKVVAEYILLSIKQNLSYDALEKLWARGGIDRIPCSRTGFYYTKKYFYHLFDLEIRRIGK